MRKKNGFIFLGLGIIMIILFVMMNNNKIIDNNPNSLDNNIIYDYIKSHDYHKKTKVTFPIQKELVRDNLYNEYNRIYSNNDNFVSASIIENMTTEEYIKKEFNDFSKDYTIESNELTCKYKCIRYKISNLNQTYADELHIYLDTSEKEIAKIVYRLENNSFSNDLINLFINNISVSFDANYKIGTVNDNKQVVEFETKNNNIRIILDSNKYEEIESEFNTLDLTTLKDKESNSFVYLVIYEVGSKSIIKDKLDVYFNIDNPGSNVKEITINDKLFYEYDVSGVLKYAYILDDEIAVLIQPTESINISDFTNIIFRSK